MRQLHLALLVAHREIVPAAVVEVAHAGEAHAVAVDERPRHHRDFRPPMAIVRGRDGDPPRDDTDEDQDQGHGMRRRRDSQSAQTANAAKATASPRRKPGHGRFE